MRIILFANEGGSQPPCCFKTMHASRKTEHHVITMFAASEGYADRFVCKPRCFNDFDASMLPAKKQHHIITRFAVSEICADHFVCRWGRAAHPPPNLRCVKATHLCNEKKQGVITMLAVRKVVRIVFFAFGGRSPPNPSAFLKTSMLPAKKKHHVITRFAVREVCADYFVCKWGEAAPPPTLPLF